MGKRLIYLYALLLFASYVCCQNLNYRSFRNIIPSSEASTVNCFVQDTQGLIWIGTNKGLFCYNGYSTQQHFVFGEKTNTLIHAIVTYGDSHLYLCTDNGILIYNYKTD
ncbi:MAG: hypothetical protein LBL79_01980, partial [Prevotella sp.]|nr:hypothetical protein [Prevotella sp.]